jgi:hypothetical protein
MPWANGLVWEPDASRLEIVSVGLLPKVTAPVRGWSRQGPRERRSNPAPKHKGVGVAWFPGDTSLPLSPEMLLHDVISGVPDRLVYLFVGSALSSSEPNMNKPPNVRRGAVEMILKSKVVVEQSPPIALPLGKLLLKAPGVAIGTYVGMQAADGNTMLMLATVPGGSWQ